MSETRVVVQERDADQAKTRRRFLKAGAVVAAGGAATIAMPNVSRAQTTVLKMQGAWAATDILNDMAMEYVDRVNKMSGNRLRIEYLLAGAVVRPFSIMDAVHEGVLDAGHHVTVYWYGKHKAASLFGTGPYLGWNATQGLAWIHKGGGKELYNELVHDILKLNVVGFFATPMPTQPLGWFKKPIKSVADLRGLKYRTVGLAADLFQKMGLSVAQLPGGEILPAMERGVIDAAEFVGPHDDERGQFFRVARFDYAPGFWEPGARLHFMANLAAWNALPAQYKAALEAACAEADADMVSRYDASNPAALRRLIAGGAQLRFWPRPIMEAAWRANEELNADIARQNPRFARIMESYNRFRSDMFTWFRVAENSFDNFAFTAAQTVR